VEGAEAVAAGTKAAGTTVDPDEAVEASETAGVSVEVSVGGNGKVPDLCLDILARL